MAHSQSLEHAGSLNHAAKGPPSRRRRRGRLPSQNVDGAQTILGMLHLVSILAPHQRIPLLQEEVAFEYDVSRVRWEYTLDRKFIPS